MAVIKNAHARDMARDAIVLDLGDLHKQASEIISRARAEADQIVAAAREERERLVAGAHEEGRVAGRERGLEEGRVQGREEGIAAARAEHGAALAELESRWMSALEVFIAGRASAIDGAGADVVRLGVLIGERITKRAIAVEPDRVQDQLRAVLELVTSRTRLRLSVHPEDRALVTQIMPALAARLGGDAASIEWIDDPALERGSCIARCEEHGRVSSEVDASIGTQLDRIAEVLLPGGDETEGTGS